MSDEILIKTKNGVKSFPYIEPLQKIINQINRKKGHLGEVRSLYNICLNFASKNASIIKPEFLNENILDDIENHKTFENNVILHDFLIPTKDELREKGVIIETHGLSCSLTPVGNVCLYVDCININGKKFISVHGIDPHEVIFGDEYFSFGYIPRIFLPNDESYIGEIEIKKNDVSVPGFVSIKGVALNIHFRNIPDMDDVIEIPPFVLEFD